MELDKDFQAQLEKRLEQIGMLDVPTAAFAEQVNRFGGKETVVRMLSRSQLSPGFEKLREAGRLKLSVEALVIQGKYAPLFEDSTVDEALARLFDAGYFAG